MHLVARPILRLVDFVVFSEFLREMANRRKVRILIHDRCLKRHPRMLIEPSANHLAVFRPGVVCVQSSVNPYKPLTALLDGGEHVLLLPCVHVQLAGCTGKDNRVEICQVFRVAAEILLRQQLRVGAHLRVPQAAFLAHCVHSIHSSRDGVMLKPLRLANHENVLEMHLLRAWRCRLRIGHTERSEHRRNQERTNVFPAKTHEIASQQQALFDWQQE